MCRSLGIVYSPVMIFKGDLEEFAQIVQFESGDLRHKKPCHPESIHITVRTDYARCLFLCLDKSHVKVCIMSNIYRALAKL